MNRLELPAPPASQPYFPFPPAPRVASDPPSARRGRQKLMTLVLGLAMILLSGVAGVVGSQTSRGDPGPRLGSERSHAFNGRTANGRPSCARARPAVSGSSSTAWCTGPSATSWTPGAS
jgi:hypothetical protein